MATKKKKALHRGKIKSRNLKIIGHEPNHILEARKDIVKDSILPYTTIGVVMLIGVLWLLYAISTFFICGIIGMVVLVLSIIFISIGLSQSQRIAKLKPITVYEDGLELPWPGKKKMFFKFSDFHKFNLEEKRGYETIVVKKGEDEYPVVLWDNLAIRMKQPIGEIDEIDDEKPEVYDSIFRPENIDVMK